MLLVFLLVESLLLVLVGSYSSSSVEQRVDGRDDLGSASADPVALRLVVVLIEDGELLLVVKHWTHGAVTRRRTARDDSSRRVSRRGAFVVRFGMMDDRGA